MSDPTGLVVEAVVVAPSPSQNQRDALGHRTAQDVARRIAKAHQAGLTSRRERDLVSEMLLLHIDGAGDSQWASIYNGQRVEIPRLISEYRKTENLLRLIVDNAVAHHTTMPLKFFAESTPDRKSRDRALIDMLFANHLSEQQDLNGLFADALYMAMATGFCPVHRYWREGMQSGYESVSGVMEPRPGAIDCWVGNPFDTVFGVDARRGSTQWCSYGRVLSAHLVRAAFAHVPGAEKLEGSKRIPSASIFQRIAKSWRLEGLGVHGSSVLQDRRDAESDEELIEIVCREVLPGVETDWPEGRLQIVALPGSVDLRRGENAASRAVLLADQPLPAGDFSWTNFYSHHRSDDIHGKPWVEDCDQLQVDLNIALSKRWEYLNRSIEAPIVAPGGAISEDMMDLGGYNLMEIEPSLASWRPRAIEWPAWVLQGLDKEIAEKRQAIFTGGGYQASSRGEAAGSRMAYRAIVALQQADNTIHGPVNMRFRRSACDFMLGCWRQMKRYGDVPWRVRVAGDEYSYLVEPYVDASKLSDVEPSFKLVNAFGPSPEMMAQEILELVAMRGADGEPLLSTEAARRAYPNPVIMAGESFPKAVQRRRAKTIAAAMTHMATVLREQNGFTEQNIAHPWVKQAGMQVFQQAEQQYPRMRDDDLMAHLASLSEVTQDETADPIARVAAGLRMEQYYAWQAQQAGQMQPGQAPQSTAPQGAPQAGASTPNSIDPRAIAAQAAVGAQG